MASLAYEQLRTGASAPELGFKERDPGLGLLWRKFTEKNLSYGAIGDLCSAAIQFSDAHYMQACHAFLRNGGEIPEHAALKKKLREDRRPLSSLNLKKIEAAEAGRRRRPDRQAKSQDKRIRFLAAKLEALLAKDLSLVSLNPGAAKFLSQLTKERPTQSDLHSGLRKEALSKMVQVMPNPKRPNWKLLSDLIHEASENSVDS